MSERVTNVTSKDLLNDVVYQNTYCGVSEWNKSGITGKGVVVWNMEQYTDHGCMTHDRILDAAPGATVLNGGMRSHSTGKEVEYAKVAYQKTPETDVQYYELEEFIRDFHVKIVTRSFGGELANKGSNRPMDKLWCELAEKYNLIIFDAADNDGDEEKDGANALPILVQAVGLIKGKPKRENYSSTVTAGDVFAAFVGWANGTSFACPYMAGMTALLVERYGSDLTQAQIVEYFKAHAEDLGDKGYDKYHGYGLAMLGDVKEDSFGGTEEMADFKDVKKDAWYAEAVDYCTDKGYLNGYPDGTFRPDANVTRAQIAQILYNMAKANGEV